MLALFPRTRGEAASDDVGEEIAHDFDDLCCGDNVFMDQQWGVGDSIPQPMGNGLDVLARSLLTTSTSTADTDQHPIEVTENLEALSA